MNEAQQDNGFRVDDGKGGYKARAYHRPSTWVVEIRELPCPELEERLLTFEDSLTGQTPRAFTLEYQGQVFSVAKDMNGWFCHPHHHLDSDGPMPGGPDVRALLHQIKQYAERKQLIRAGKEEDLIMALNKETMNLLAGQRRNRDLLEERDELRKQVEELNERLGKVVEERGLARRERDSALKENRGLREEASRSEGQFVERPAEEMVNEIEALQDMLNDARWELAEVDKIIALPAEPHQHRRERREELAWLVERSKTLAAQENAEREARVKKAFLEGDHKSVQERADEVVRGASGTVGELFEALDQIEPGPAVPPHQVAAFNDPLKPITHYVCYDKVGGFIVRGKAQHEADPPKEQWMPVAALSRLDAVQTGRRLWEDWEKVLEKQAGRRAPVKAPPPVTPQPEEPRLKDDIRVWDRYALGALARMEVRGPYAFDEGAIASTCEKFADDMMRRRLKGDE